MRAAVLETARSPPATWPTPWSASRRRCHLRGTASSRRDSSTPPNAGRSRSPCHTSASSFARSPGSSAARRLSEDADATRPHEQADDDEQDPHQQPAADRRDDAPDDEDDGDDPQKGNHGQELPSRARVETRGRNVAPSSPIQPVVAGSYRAGHDRLHPGCALHWMASDVHARPAGRRRRRGRDGLQDLVEREPVSAAAECATRDRRDGGRDQPLPGHDQCRAHRRDRDAFRGVARARRSRPGALASASRSCRRRRVPATR